MQDRAKIVDENFIKFLQKKQFPAALTQISVQQAGLTKEAVVDLFHSQVVSRQLDLQARVLKQKNQSYYTIASSGHEGNCVLGKVFRTTDMAFLHYRSCALMIQRAKQLDEKNSVYDQLLSLVAAKDEPISGGRHKVFGSLSLNVPPQTSTIASHLPKAVGCALSITRAKELELESNIPYDGVILASFGDASVNHSTAQGAFNAAKWIAYQQYPLPLVFVCEDNQLGISVATPENWIEDQFSNQPGLHYISADGLSILDVYRASCEAEIIAREKKQPVFLHLKMVRLLGHAGTDIETQYRSEQAIQADELNDPLLHTARIIVENDYLSESQVIALYLHVAKTVEKLAQQATEQDKLTSAREIMLPIIPRIKDKKSQPAIDENLRRETFAESYAQLDMPRNMSQQINLALTDLMLAKKNIVVFGEDVGKKGGVYRVTADLQQRFGQRRVFDTLLDEQTILGTAIGMAHNGLLPIAEIQFLAYLHNAEDQLRGEAATLSFFSQGQFYNPMIIRIPSFAYQKGIGGHFHNENSIAVLRDIPGLIIACPSNGNDAAKMLRTCVAKAQEEKRICVFLEPIALYMTKDLYEKGDNVWLSNYPEPTQVIDLGEIVVVGESDEVAIITYANGYYLSLQARHQFEKKYQCNVKVIDLRWLAPLNEQAILAAVAKCKNILIVDEARKTGSISEALVTLLVENLTELPTIKRLTGEDCFIPLGPAWEQILPSCEKIIQALVELTNKV